MCLCEGVIPANGEVDISLVFCPTSFQTATAKLQLTISQYMSESLLCTVVGRSAPGLCRLVQFTSTLLTLSRNCRWSFAVHVSYVKTESTWNSVTVELAQGIPRYFTIAILLCW